MVDPFAVIGKKQKAFAVFVQPSGEAERFIR